MTISYRSESFAIELHILIMVIATMVTIIGLTLGYIWKARGIVTTKSITLAGVTTVTRAQSVETAWDNFLKDIIPATGIILAFVTPIITSVFNPILDYSISEDIQNNTAIHVTINNYGLTNAKNIEVYFNSPGKDFTKFASMPTINGTVSMTSEKLKESGSGIFYIPTLPSRSETLVTAWVKQALSDPEKVTVYVRSDTSTGVHNVGPLTAAYIVYAIALTFNAGYVMWQKWIIKKGDIFVLVAGNAVAIFAIFCILFFGACEANGNCLSHGINQS